MVVVSRLALNEIQALDTIYVSDGHAESSVTVFPEAPEFIYLTFGNGGGGRLFFYGGGRGEGGAGGGGASHGTGIERKGGGGGRAESPGGGPPAQEGGPGRTPPGPGLNIPPLPDVVAHWPPPLLPSCRFPPFPDTKDVIRVIFLVTQAISYYNESRTSLQAEMLIHSAAYIDKRTGSARLTQMFSLI